MKLVLPLDTNPIAVTYQMRAYELGAVGAFLGDIRPWLCDKFIYGIYTPNGRFVFDFNVWDRWFVAEGTSVNERLILNKEIIESGLIDLLDLVKRMIDRGYYFVGFYNGKFIPDKWAYNKYDFDHDFLVYGYDDEKRIFYSCGYRADNHYGKLETPYEALLSGIVNTVSGESQLDFYRINEKHDFSLNIPRLKAGLEDYLRSTNRFYSTGVPRYFGIEAERYFSIYIDEHIDLDSKIDMRYPRVFWELKKIMKTRLEYLSECGLIPEKLVADYIPLLNDANKIFFLSLKYNLTKDKGILHRIVELNEKIIRSQEPIVWNTLVKL